MAGVTQMIVAQRVSSLRHADLILVLEEGRVIGRGNHQSLLQTCPVYREIAETQMGTEGRGTGMENRSGVLGADRQNRQKRGLLPAPVALFGPGTGCFWLLRWGLSWAPTFWPSLAPAGGRPSTPLRRDPAGWISPLFGTGRQPWRCFTCCRPACPTPVSQ